MSYGYENRGPYENPGFGWAARLIPILIGLVFIGATMVRGCQHGPFGRTQVVAITPAQEAALGMQAYREVLSTSHVVHAGSSVAAVQRVTKRLIEATTSSEFQSKIGITIPKFDWELEVVEDKQVNAFCLPGGKIVVYTGILPVSKTDAGLATVIGHEISHALAHHGSERMAQQQIANIGLTAAGASIGDMDPAKRQQIMVMLNAGTKFGILKYSRNHESEADHMGLLLMAAAGYDPHESIEFWKRMSAATTDSSAPPEFASTHPSHGTRIRDLTNWIPEAMKLYDTSKVKAPAEKMPDVKETRGPRPGL